MVVGGLVALAALGLAFFFRDEIGLFLKGFKAAGDVQEATGGIVETIAKRTQSSLSLTPLPDDPLFGVGGALTPEGFKKQLDAEIADIQTNVNLISTGVNETLVNAQKQLEAFAESSQKQIEDTVNSIVKDTQDFFGSFGGQQEIKPVITEVEATPLIQTQSGQSFEVTLTEGSTQEEILAESTRFGGTGSLR